MPWLEPVTLENDAACLVPLAQDHAEDLKAAAADGALWELWYTTVPKPEDLNADIDKKREMQTAGSMLPFAVFAPGGSQAVGVTTFMNADAANKRVEIGSTWYARSVQRSPLNTNCKYLLLRHAFETLGCNAVELRTHVMNLQSRRAIERLGAKLDGILRNHMIMPNGTLRDTAVYSILNSEWPAVEANLKFRMQAR